MSIQIRLLGAPAIYHDGEWLEPAASRVSAMLYYLAYQNEWVSRNNLAFLFWSDIPEENARSNLRKVLTRARSLPYPSSLEAERTRLRWQVETDTANFKKAIAEQQLTKAVDCYSGELLSGFYVDGVLEFENWLETERQTLYEEWRESILSLAHDYDIEKKHAQAADTLAHLTKAEPLDEDVVQRQLKQLHLSNQKTRALSLFDTFEQKLKQEFDGVPEQTTLELVKVIRESKNDAHVLANEALMLDQTAALGYKLPVQATTFIGRRSEIKRLSEQLSDPSCRLITLVAPGGLGKTRLALAVGEKQQDMFKDSACFVSFVSTETPETMIFTLAASLNLNFNSQSNPKEQLLHYLSSKAMLLILDNLEHLLDGVELIAEILEQAPQVKILATSRERLNLRAEWLFDLVGLSVPENNQVAIETYDAVKLLIQTAKKIQADFELSEGDRRASVQICQLVAGMPLAIELAVNWLRLMPLEEIALEIEKGIDLFEASTRDSPERHRSIRAVFDYSWNLLSEKEQQALINLLVFKGGFDRKAAAQISNVKLSELSLLVDKSFLNTTPNGRYYRHPLVLQYVEEKGLDEKEKTELSEKHAWHYLNLIQESNFDLRTLKRKETLQRLEQDIENIRLAWQWMLKTLNLEAIKTFAFAFTDFFENRLVECAELLTEALRLLDENDPRHHAALGYIYVSLVDIQFGGSAFGFLPEFGQKGITLLRPLNEIQGIIRGLYAIAFTEWSLGHCAISQRYAQEGLELAKQHDIKWDTSKLYQVLTFAERELSSFSKVSQLYQEGIEDAQNRKDMLGLCFLNHQYGAYLIHNNELKAGEDLLQEAMQLANDLDYRKMVSFINDDRALAALKAANYDLTETLSHETLKIAADPQTFSPYGRVKAWTRLARVAIAKSDFEAAQQFLQSSLKLARNIQSTFGILASIAYFGEWYLVQGQFEKAAPCLYYVKGHYALLNELKIDLIDFLKSLQANLSPDAIIQVEEQVQNLDLDTLIIQLV